MDKVLVPKSGSKIVKKSLEEQTKGALEKEAKKILDAGERTQMSDELADLVRCATAYHHAGLSGAHRKIIEDAFKDRKIKVLTATPTLHGVSTCLPEQSSSRTTADLKQDWATIP